MRIGSKAIGEVGVLVRIGSGILMYILWWIAMDHWLGSLGFFLSVLFLPLLFIFFTYHVLFPGLVIFPIIFWIIEGAFPTFYFIVYAVGAVGMIISRIFSGDE